MKKRNIADYFLPISSNRNTTAQKNKKKPSIGTSSQPNNVHDDNRAPKEIGTIEELDSGSRALKSSNAASTKVHVNKKLADPKVDSSEEKSFPTPYHKFLEYTNILDLVDAHIKIARPHSYEQFINDMKYVRKVARRCYLLFYMQPKSRKKAPLKDLTVSENCPEQLKMHLMDFPAKYQRKKSKKVKTSKNLVIEVKDDLLYPKPNTSKSYNSKPVDNSTDCFHLQTSTISSNCPPPSFKFFKKFVNFEDEIKQRMLGYAEDDSEINKSNLREKVALEFYKEFYGSPTLRHKLNWKLRPCPRKIREQILTHLPLEDDFLLPEKSSEADNISSTKLQKEVRNFDYPMKPCTSQIKNLVLEMPTEDDMLKISVNSVPSNKRSSSPSKTLMSPQAKKQKFMEAIDLQTNTPTTSHINQQSIPNNDTPKNVHIKRIFSPNCRLLMYYCDKKTVNVVKAKQQIIQKIIMERFMNAINARKSVVSPEPAFKEFVSPKPQEKMSQEIQECSLELSLSSEDNLLASTCDDSDETDVNSELERTTVRSNTICPKEKEASPMSCTANVKQKDDNTLNELVKNAQADTLVKEGESMSQKNFKTSTLQHTKKDKIFGEKVVNERNEIEATKKSFSLEDKCANLASAYDSDETDVNSELEMTTVVNAMKTGLNNNSKTCQKESESSAEKTDIAKGNELPFQPEKKNVEILSVKIISTSEVTNKYNMETEPTKESKLQDCIIDKFFRKVDKSYTLAFAVRRSRGLKRRILLAVLKMSMKEFATYTRIHEHPKYYEDSDVLKKVYEFVIMNEQTWPPNLYMTLSDTLEYFMLKGIVMQDLDLQHISPKLLHFEELAKITNFDEIVYLDYFKEKAKKLDDSQLKERRLSYYNRCWAQDEWIWQVPTVYDNWKLTVKHKETDTIARLRTPPLDDICTCPDTEEIEMVEAVDMETISTSSYRAAVDIEPQDTAYVHLVKSSWELVLSELGKSANHLKRTEDDVETVIFPFNQQESTSSSQKSFKTNDSSVKDMQDIQTKEIANKDEFNSIEISDHNKAAVAIESQDTVTKHLVEFSWELVLSELEKSAKSLKRTEDDVETVIFPLTQQESTSALKKSYKINDSSVNYIQNIQTKEIANKDELNTIETRDQNKDAASTSAQPAETVKQKAIILNSLDVSCSQNLESTSELTQTISKDHESNQLQSNIVKQLPETTNKTLLPLSPNIFISSSGGSTTSQPNIQHHLTQSCSSTLTFSNASLTISSCTSILTQVNDFFVNMPNTQIQIESLPTDEMCIDPLNDETMLKESMETNLGSVLVHKNLSSSDLAVNDAESDNDYRQLNTQAKTCTAYSKPPDTTQLHVDQSVSSAEPSEERNLVSNQSSSTSEQAASFQSLSQPNEHDISQAGTIKHESLLMNENGIVPLCVKQEILNQNVQLESKSIGHIEDCNLTTIVIDDSDDDAECNQSTNNVKKDIKEEPKFLNNLQFSLDDSNSSVHVHTLQQTPAIVIDDDCNVNKTVSEPAKNLIDQLMNTTEQTTVPSLLLSGISSLQLNDTASTLCEAQRFPSSLEESEFIHQTPQSEPDQETRNSNDSLNSSEDVELLFEINVQKVIDFDDQDDSVEYEQCETETEPEVALNLKEDQQSKRENVLPTFSGDQTTNLLSEVKNSMNISEKKLEKDLQTENKNSHLVPQITHAFRSLPVTVVKTKSNENPTITEINTAPSTSRIYSSVTEISNTQTTANNSGAEDSTKTVDSGSTTKSFSTSQALATDCTLFDNSQLLRDLEKVQSNYIQPSTAAVCAELKATSTTSPIASVASTTSSSLQVNEQNRNLHKTIICRDLYQFHYFSALNEKHIANYELPHMAFEQQYMQAHVRLRSGYRLNIFGSNFVKLLFPTFSHSNICDLFYVLNDMKEYHFYLFNRSMSANVDLRERVLFYLFYSTPIFCYCNLKFDVNLREYATCVPITSEHNKSLTRQPHLPLTASIKPSILRNISKLKSQLALKK